MIKLIATDIDGTLVKDSSPEVDACIPQVLHALIEKGYVCCVASGRQFHSIQSVFQAVAKEIVYIAENGALIHYHGKNLYVKSMQREHVEEIVKDYRKYKDTYDLGIVVSTPDGCYLETEDEAFIHLMEYGYHNKFQVVEDVLALDISVLKIAFYQKGSIRRLGEGILIPKWHSKVKTCMAGEEWVDFMDAAVDKGHALSFLQEYFGIGRDETMTFGDNANDIGMLQNAEESYVVENAREDVKKHAKYVCKPYWEKGVYHILKELL